MADFPIGFPYSPGGAPLVDPATLEGPDAAPTLRHRADVPAEGLALLLGQFHGKPRLEAVIRALLDGVQDAENALWQLYSERWVDTAVGRQLDELGGVLDLPRAGRLDETYRAFLRARVRVLRSDGTYRALVGILSVIGAELLEVARLEAGDAAASQIRLLDALPANVSGPDVFAMLDAARAGGVRLAFEYPAVGADAAGSFSFANGTVETASPNGYGSSNDATDGGVYGGARASTARI